MDKGIIVCGLNGCGKSTLGRALAQELGFVFLDNEDLYFKRTEDSAPYTDPCTRQEAEARLRELLNGCGSFVFAGMSCNA